MHIQSTSPTGTEGMLSSLEVSTSTAVFTFDEYCESFGESVPKSGVCLQGLLAILSLDDELAIGGPTPYVVYTFGITGIRGRHRRG